ncbi:MAG: MBL fold metallo-hydrolase [Patescibacteria group bacterium]|nr:MBL fold metallo-hydrolase [Patescibacteria group bacterium]
MQIFWHGLSCIRIEAKTGEAEATLVTDPYSNETGLRFPRTLEADILALTHQDKKLFNIEAVGGEPFVVSEPGEYEVANLFVHSIQDPEAEQEKLRSIIYRFDSEGMKIAFLGNLKRQLTNFEIETLGDIDILMVPVGGSSVLDAKGAANVIKAIEPRIVVPIHYYVQGIKEKLNDVDAFCKQLGVCKRENVNKLKIEKKDLPMDEMLVYVIERT